MATRTPLNLELRPLLKAIESRLTDRPGLSTETRDRFNVYKRDGVTFLELEQRRDHITLDFWLSKEQREDARSSGIARAHPFQEDNAIRVRFERAEDLPQVSRWLEAAYDFAAHRDTTELEDAREAQKAQSGSGEN